MNTAQKQALAKLLARLTESNWTLDQSTLRLASDGVVVVKARPAWSKGWGATSYAWYSITTEGQVRA